MLLTYNKVPPRLIFQYNEKKQRNETSLNLSGSDLGPRRDLHFRLEGKGFPGNYASGVGPEKFLRAVSGGK